MNFVTWKHVPVHERDQHAGATAGVLDLRTLPEPIALLLCSGTGCHNVTTL